MVSVNYLSYLVRVFFLRHKFRGKWFFPNRYFGGGFSLDQGFQGVRWYCSHLVAWPFFPRPHAMVAAMHTLLTFDGCLLRLSQASTSISTRPSTVGFLSSKSTSWNSFSRFSVSSALRTLCAHFASGF